MIIEDRESVYKLFPSLVKFYADVETTGSHTEFYDKFFIRRNLQIIFKYMWEDLVQRDRIIRVAK
jgi:ubiquitin conjugation factor E4 B